MEEEQRRSKGGAKEEEKKERRRTTKELKVGDEVRVISGMFSGHVGEIRELERNSARVILGKMTVNVSVKDLMPKS